MQSKEPAETSDDARLMDAEGVIEMMALGMTTFRKMLEEGRFPPPIFITPRIQRWRRETVLAWLRDKEDNAPGPGRPRSGDT